MDAPPIEVIELDAAALPAASTLVDRVWGSPPDRRLLEPNTLRAFHLSGEQILGAFPTGRTDDPGAIVGVSIAFVGTHPGGFHLHSHITGVDREHEGLGVGFTLKLAQRAWTLERGITNVRWTFDPLIARNAHFNLTKLGARGIRYHVDLYGAMPDALNAGDESDRVEAWWDLTAPVGNTEPDIDTLRRGGAEVVLDIADPNTPVIPTSPFTAPTLLARTPTDVVALRMETVLLARAWRVAARETIGRALGCGYVATAATRDGWWILERSAAQL